MNRIMPGLYPSSVASWTGRGRLALLLIACFVLLVGCSGAERELDRAVERGFTSSR